MTANTIPVGPLPPDSTPAPLDIPPLPPGFASEDDYDAFIASLPAERRDARRADDRAGYTLGALLCAPAMRSDAGQATWARMGLSVPGIEHVPLAQYERAAALHRLDLIARHGPTLGAARADIDHALTTVMARRAPTARQIEKLRLAIPVIGEAAEAGDALCMQMRAGLHFTLVAMDTMHMAQGFLT